MSSPSQITMDFCEAQKAVLRGQRIRRLSWEDLGIYGLLHNGQLCLYKPEDGLIHPWIVNDGDMLAEDWVTLDVMASD